MSIFRSKLLRGLLLAVPVRQKPALITWKGTIRVRVLGSICRSGVKSSGYFSCMVFDFDILMRVLVTTCIYGGVHQK
jgi:hypothetical protein